MWNGWRIKDLGLLMTVLQLIGGAIVAYIAIFLAFVLLRKAKSPEKSWINCTLNVALQPLRMFKIGPYKHGKISIEGSMKQAMKKTKLSDFGGSPAEFCNMYNLILNSESHKKQKFHNLGYISANIEISMALARRLMFVKYMQDNPDLLKISVRSPVFVMGLPRTGTTFLHRLLSLDPKVRSPLTWELLNPVPRVNGTDVAAHEEDRQKRRRYVKKIIETRRKLGDNALAHIHEIGADLPEECLLCLTDFLPCLPMLLYDVYMNIDTFLELDPTDAYTMYRKYLQLLSYQCGESEDPKKWVLKCPIHMFYPKQLAKVFPDAKLIWNHRHPASAVPSLCSLVKAFHQVYYEPDSRDDHALGQKIKYVSEQLLQQTPKDVAASGLDCANVVYNDLIRDPVKVVKDIYQQFNWEFSAEYDNVLREYLDKNAADRAALKKKGKAELHSYSPEEFGLNMDDLVSGGFGEYVKAYNVPMSKN